VAAPAGEPEAQTTEPPQARAAEDASASPLAAQPPEPAATEASGDESGPEAPAQDGEPLARRAAEAEAAEVEAGAEGAEPAATEASGDESGPEGPAQDGEPPARRAAEAEAAEVEAGAEGAEPAATEASAAEPVLEAPAQAGEPPAQGAARDPEVPEVEAQAEGPEPAEVEAGTDSPQPVPMPKPEPDSPRPVPLPEPESESTAIPPAAAIVQAEAAPVSLEAPGMPARGLYELAWGTGLLNVAAIAQKELAAILRWPIAYLAWALVIVLTSIFGYLPQINASAPVSMSGIFNWLALLMAFFVPLCTMRMLAGEQRSGSLEMLLTSPVRFWELVAGKWLGGFLLYAVTITFTLVYVILMSAYQQLHAPAAIFGLQVSLPGVDYGSVVTGYTGILLVGAAWVALGVLASSLTQNQIVAAAAGFAALFALEYGLGALSGFVTPPLSDLFDYLAASSRAQSFNDGQIVFRDLVYFVTLTLGALFLTIRVVESRRWR